MLDWRLKAYRHWLTMTEPHWAERAAIRRSTTRTSSTTRRRSRRSTGRRASTRSIPSCCATYEKLGIPLRRAGAARRRRRRRGLRQRLGRAPRSRRSSAELGIIFCSFSEAVQRASRAGAASTSARSCRTPTTSSPRSTRRSSPTARSATSRKGVRCPMELSTYFRINAAEHRPVRAHADHRRRRRLRQLPRRLHGADARREPAARRGGRAGRARRRADQVLDGAELVPGRQGRQGRHLQLRHQARQLPRRATRRSPGPRSRPARRSPGSIRAASCRATTRSASSTRSR